MYIFNFFYDKFVYLVVIFFIKCYYIKRIEGVRGGCDFKLFYWHFKWLCLCNYYNNFYSERKFNLENNGILTKTYHNENEDEIILGDQTLYDKKEEVLAHSTYIPNMNTASSVASPSSNDAPKNTNSKDEVI